MRYLFLVLIAVLLVTSCEEKGKKKMLLDSSGKLNDVSVVIENQMWEGRVGEAIRDVLAAPIYGLPQDEPIFIINQIPPIVFTGFITKNRTVLKIETGKTAAILFDKNIYAQPQKVITVTGNTKDEIINLIKENASRIVETFKGIELLEKQKTIKKSLYNTREIKDNLGLSINFPSAYKISKTIAKKDDKFYWIKRDTKTGYVNILLYELPLKTIKRDTSLINQVIKIRDSIGKKYIGGPVDGSYMITQNVYTPYHGETILNNKPTLETKGMWNVKNAVMAGPFINYAIEDKVNNRWVVVEGFAYAPSVSKRDLIFELEAIIKSIIID